MLLSLESIVRDRIQLAIESLDYPPLQIPIKRDGNTTQVRYRSAIAFKLAPHLPQTPIEIARPLAERLQDPVCDVHPNRVPQQWKNIQFFVTVSSPGWLDFSITDSGLADWLQHLLREDLPVLPTSTVPTGKSPFLIQYTHARCCSLLRLAQDEGLLCLDALQITEPNPIPWLHDRARTLALQNPAERSLITEFVAIVDAIHSPKLPNSFGLGEGLSQKFERFERQCRIFGLVARETPHLAQGRSGLVSATQKILNSLLTRGLGLVSPCKL